MNKEALNAFDQIVGKYSIMSKGPSICNEAYGREYLDVRSFHETE